MAYYGKSCPMVAMKSANPITLGTPILLLATYNFSIFNVTLITMPIQPDATKVYAILNISPKCPSVITVCICSLTARHYGFV